MHGATACLQSAHRPSVVCARLAVFARLTCNRRDCVTCLPQDQWHIVFPMLPLLKWGPTPQPARSISGLLAGQNSTPVAGPIQHVMKPVSWVCLILVFYPETKKLHGKKQTDVTDSLWWCLIRTTRSHLVKESLGFSWACCNAMMKAMQVWHDLKALVNWWRTRAGALMLEYPICRPMKHSNIQSRGNAYEA